MRKKDEGGQGRKKTKKHSVGKGSEQNMKAEEKKDNACRKRE